MAKDWQFKSAEQNELIKDGLLFYIFINFNKTAVRTVYAGGLNLCLLKPVIKTGDRVRTESEIK